MRIASALKSVGQIVMILGPLVGILMLVGLGGEANFQIAGIALIISGLINGLMLLGFGIAVENLTAMRRALESKNPN